MIVQLRIRTGCGALSLLTRHVRTSSKSRLRRPDEHRRLAAQASHRPPRSPTHPTYAYPTMTKLAALARPKPKLGRALTRALNKGRTEGPKSARAAVARAKLSRIKVTGSENAVPAPAAVSAKLRRAKLDQKRKCDQAAQKAAAMCLKYQRQAEQLAKELAAPPAADEAEPGRPKKKQKTKARRGEKQEVTVRTTSCRRPAACSPHVPPLPSPPPSARWPRST